MEIMHIKQGKLCVKNLLKLHTFTKLYELVYTLYLHLSNTTHHCPLKFYKHTYSLNYAPKTITRPNYALNYKLCPKLQIMR